MAINGKKQDARTPAPRGDPALVLEELRALEARINSLQRADPEACIKLIEEKIRFIYENERWPEDFFAVLRVYQRCWAQTRLGEPFEDALTAQLKKNAVPAVMATLLRGGDSSISWNADFFKDLALVSEAKGEFETALSYADLSAKIDPSNAQACVVRGWILLDLGREDEAVEMFLLAYELNPQNHAANNALAKHYAAKEPEKALGFADRALEAMPGEGRYHETKSKILARTGNLDGAIGCLDAAMLASPYEAEYPFAKGELLMLQEKEIAASAMFRKALALNDRHIPSLNRLAKLYEQSQPDLALAYVNTICTIETENTAAKLEKAKLLQRLGENKAAEQLYQMLMELEPRNAEALAGMGALALFEDPTAAVCWFGRAIACAESDEKLYEYRMGKGRAHEELGQKKEAAKEYKAAASLDRKKAAPLARLAFLLEETSPREAEGYFERAVSLAPDNALYMAALAELIFKRGDYSRAKEVLLEASRLDPANPRLHIMLGRLLEQGGNAASALEHYRTAASLAPQEQETAPAYASIAKLIMDSDPGSALLHINSAVSLAPESAEYCHLKGKILMALGENRQALIALRDSLKADSKNPELLGEIAQLLEPDSPNLAMYYLNRAVELEPKNSQYISARAEMLVRVGEGDKALPQFEAVLRRDPKDHRALFGMARCLEKTNPARALEFIDKAIAANSDLAEYHALRAELCADRGQAIEAIGRAIAIEGGNVGFLLKKAMLLKDHGQPAPAAECFRSALALEPQNIAAHRHLGLLLAESSAQAALEHLDAAVDAEPEDAVLRAQRGKVLTALGRNDEAASDYADCVKLGGGGPNVLFTLAGILSATLPETALGFCLRAVEEDGSKTEYLLLLGRLCEALGRPEDAVGAYQRAIKADPACHAAAEQASAIIGTVESADEALESSPDCAVCLLHKAKLLLGSDDAAVLDCLARAAKSDPGSIEICELRVYLLEKKRSVVRLAIERRRLRRLRAGRIN